MIIHDHRAFPMQEATLSFTIDYMGVSEGVEHFNLSVRRNERGGVRGLRDPLSLIRPLVRLPVRVRVVYRPREGERSPGFAAYWLIDGRWSGLPPKEYRGRVWRITPPRERWELVRMLRASFAEIDSLAEALDSVTEQADAVTEQAEVVLRCVDRLIAMSVPPQAEAVPVPRARLDVLLADDEVHHA